MQRNPASSCYRGEDGAATWHSLTRTRAGRAGRKLKRSHLLHLIGQALTSCPQVRSIWFPHRSWTTARARGIHVFFSARPLEAGSFRRIELAPGGGTRRPDGSRRQRPGQSAVPDASSTPLRSIPSLPIHSTTVIHCYPLTSLRCPSFTEETKVRAVDACACSFAPLRRS
jgi:hypothetical protein